MYLAGCDRCACHGSSPGAPRSHLLQSCSCPLPLQICWTHCSQSSTVSCVESVHAAGSRGGGDSSGGGAEQGGREASPQEGCSQGRGGRSRYRALRCAGGLTCYRAARARSAQQDSDRCCVGRRRGSCCGHSVRTAVHEPGKRCGSAVGCCCQQRSQAGYCLRGSSGSKRAAAAAAAAASAAAVTDAATATTTTTIMDALPHHQDACRHTWALQG
jgi:hypothetical protein